MTVKQLGVSWQLPRPCILFIKTLKNHNSCIFCTLCVLVVQIRNSHLKIEVEPEWMLVVSRWIILFEDCFKPSKNCSFRLRHQPSKPHLTHMKSYDNFSHTSFTLKFQQDDNITINVKFHANFIHACSISKA